MLSDEVYFPVTKKLLCSGKVHDREKGFVMNHLGSQ